MVSQTNIVDPKKYLDPVFLKRGVEVYSYEYAELLRKENVELKRQGKRIWNILPQAGFQEKVLTSKADLVICGGSRGSGKVQPNDTQIITPRGRVLLGNLKIGDTITDPTTGGKEKVVNIFEHPDHDFYELTFNDGAKTRCGKEHLWKVRCGGSGWIVIHFGVIAEWIDKGYRVAIPMVRPKTKKIVKDLERTIISYKYIGKADGRCITVDSPGSLYLCDDFIVTHNTAISLIGALDYAENPDVSMYGFRRFEADVKRGIYKSSKPIFRGFAEFADTEMRVKFFKGNGATMTMEHLADLSKVKDRFRGAEMPYIVIEELAEFTKESMSVVFDLMGSNRSTTGLRSRFICTCNPVGRSNKLRWFLDWWIDPQTDLAIPERSGKIRYFCRYGEDIMEIAWGDTPEEVFANPNAHSKICSLTDDPEHNYKDYITSCTFIDGAYGENKILQVSDTKYMNRISSGGSKSVINDIRGIWRDVDDSGSLITSDDMNRFFTNVAQTNGIRVAGGDIALRDDWFVLWAMDGWHIIDVEAKKYVNSDNVVPMIQDFLRRNNVPMENFAYDVNGIGNWLKQSPEMRNAFAFDNKAGAHDKTSYTKRKSECAGMLIEAIQDGRISIEESVLRKTFTEKRIPFTIQERLMQERMVLRWRVADNPKELIKKVEMKDLIGHSPDFLEALLYCIDRVDECKRHKITRKGFGFFF